MQAIEAAQKILEVFREKENIVCLKDLAKQAGFKTAASIDFKEGLNYLISKGILKLNQSGWKSEKRNSKGHMKMVVLLVDLYQLLDSDLDIALDRSSIGKLASMKGEQQIFMVHPISETILNNIRSCEQCKSKPSVFITVDGLPVCEKHWERLAGSDYEWG